MSAKKILPFDLIDTKPITHDTKLFRFAIPPGVNFDFLPGDHVRIFPDHDDPVEWRQYSPVTSPDIKDHFDLIIKRYELGVVSRYVHERNEGDQIWMSGPESGGHLESGMADHIGMVAGGAGITPIISMVRTALEKAYPVDISLVFANKSVDDIILKEEFDKYAERFPNFKRYYVVDTAPPGWTMGVGRINADILKANLPVPSDRTVIFLCGPPMFEMALKKLLMDLGHTEKNIINP